MADSAKTVVKSGFSKAVSAFFEYDTPKIVHIKSKKVGIINRLIQLVIIGYIIGYAIVWEKGYQDFDAVESSATSKLKGVIFTNTTALNITNKVYNRTWDVADYVVPPQENDAFFVMTNVIITPGQQQGECPEDPSIPNVVCTDDSNCTAGLPVVNGNGVMTGACNTSDQDPTKKTCVILAWCPVEIDETPLKDEALLKDSKAFTVLIKNQIAFPKFNITRRNILETSNKSFLQSCHFNPNDEDGKYCPIFELGKIVQHANEDYDDVAKVGGVIAINIHWDCNLDYSISKCKPEYSFTRLDKKDAKIAKGWNFRYANYYYDENKIHSRDLIKSYGIRFVIKVTGRAGKFSVVPLLLNLGSGAGLLAVATVLCDIVVLYVLKKGDYYKERKYLNVTDDDAFTVFQDEEDDTCRVLPTVSGQMSHTGALPQGFADSGSVSNYDSLGHTRPSNTQNAAAADDDSGVKRRKEKPGKYNRMGDEED